MDLATIFQLIHTYCTNKGTYYKIENVTNNLKNINTAGPIHKRVYGDLHEGDIEIRIFIEAMSEEDYRVIKDEFIQFFIDCIKPLNIFIKTEEVPQLMSVFCFLKNTDNIQVSQDTSQNKFLLE